MLRSTVLGIAIHRFFTRTTCTLHLALAVTVDATDCDQARPPSDGAPRTTRSTLLCRANSTMTSAGAPDSTACRESRWVGRPRGATQCLSLTRCSSDVVDRSEEHTPELQSLRHLVC